MVSLLSSLGRLTNPGAIALFKSVFAQHGALAGASIDLASATPFTPEERLSIVPVVFGLMPAAALDRDKYRRSPALKPLIRAHLNELGLDSTDAELVEILQHIIFTYTAGLGFPYRPTPTRASIGVVRTYYARIYAAIRELQKGRCAVCGLAFSLESEETLDHILPWKLVGDHPKGANWQILCRPCNQGKRHWLSSIQEPQAFNWWYDGQEKWLTQDQANDETRFVLLTQRGHCEVVGCGAGPKERHLHAQKLTSSGLAVADNLRVVCESHLN